MATSLVHAEYTSKACSKCGCIDDDNRKCQEDFVCVSCGHADNADHNASVNIKNRVTLTVLRDKLLKQTENNAYVPLLKKRDDIKKALLSFRYE
jgi:transposase